MRFRTLIAVLAVSIFAAAPAIAQDGAVNLLKDAVWKYSDDDGKTFTLDKMTNPSKIVARAEFTVADPAAYAGVWIMAGPAGYRWTFELNGKKVTGPFPQLLYRNIPIDASRLAKGKNTLILRGAIKRSERVPNRLLGYPAKLVSIQTGPALGACGKDYFTVTCRTNMPAAVTVTATCKPGGKEVTATSPRGFVHRLRLDIPAGTRELTYTATAKSGEASSKPAGPFAVSLPDFEGKEPLRFVATGDGRTNSHLWKRVAAAIAKARPHLMTYSGDMLGDGRWYSNWDIEYFGPAKGLVEVVPAYPVYGNHDGPPEVFRELFYTPGGDGKGMNWHQTIAGTQLIGIYGAEDWKPGSKNHIWLEGVLKESKAKFIFLMSHYPGYSSGKHGAYGEAPMEAARHHIQPLLAKYKATAMIGGHDHNYERSEPPADKGVTAITSGGAGAKLRPKHPKAAAKNPYSKSYHATLHYCLFEIQGDTCEMKVYDLGGRVLDQKTFKAR